jgi:hypothetical protein
MIHNVFRRRNQPLQATYGETWQEKRKTASKEKPNKLVRTRARRAVEEEDRICYMCLIDKLEMGSQTGRPLNHRLSAGSVTRGREM